MIIKEVNSKKLYKEYEIHIPHNEIDESINSKIAEIIPTVSLPGFRKGKAPLNIVKKKYENNVLSEVIEKIVKVKVKDLIEEKKLKVFRQPKVEIKKYKKNQPVEILIKVDLDPNIKIYPFEKIEILKRSIDVDEKTINENYKNFIESQKHYHKVSEKRPVEFKDKIILNISTEDKLAPNFLKEQKNIPVITDSSHQILPDISKKLINKKVKIGDRVDLFFDLKDILKNNKKTEVKFSIEVVSLERCHNFKVTKEFLDKNNLKNEDELKENLKKNLINQYENYLRQIEQKELMDILDIKNNFDVPEGIFQDEFNLIWHRLEHAKKEGKLDEDDKGLSENELKKRYKKIALRRVKLAILMQDIAKKEKISVLEKELTDGMLNYASQYPGQEKQIFDYFKKNPESIETIKGPIFEKKIVDYILTKVKVKNQLINLKEFKKLQEEAFNTNKEM